MRKGFAGSSIAAVLLLVIFFCPVTVPAADITGAGATFPYPLYSKWAEAYKEQTGVGLNYQSIGSGGGIKQIEAGTVDFGASDMPLKSEELEQKGLIQFPAVIGGVVPVVNIPDVDPGELRLTGDLLAKIYLGDIKKWNDPAIGELNPDVKLPDLPITVVHRSDGSGTTFIFTNYLAKVSETWKDKVGTNVSVNWPTGVGGKGNEGVASYVQRIKGSIGYVEYAYAQQNKMAYALLKNREGRFVKPDAESFQTAAAGADWEKAKGYYEILTNEPGKSSWPITGATFILMHKKPQDPARARQVLDFFDWAYKNGDDLALGLDYIPMPDKVVNMVEQSWTQVEDAGGNPVWK